jgi:excisionase family DNA binding protein
MQLTTKQAARLIQVHESSIKRWCSQDELAFTLTDGGHRRIELDVLMVFARSRDLPCKLAEFSPNEGEAWLAMRDAESKGNFESLRRLALAWIQAPSSFRVTRLMHFCLEQGLALSTLFDALIAPVLHRIGEDWKAGNLEIGEEHRITEVFRDVLYEIRSLSMTSKAQASRDSIAVVGCSEGNQHDLGAQVIRILLEQRGWQVIYLGANVPALDFATLQARHRARIVCISFVPPSIVSDAERMADMLARFYDPDNPYFLVFGGQMLASQSALRFSRPPFLELQTHATTDAFVRWLDEASFLPTD